jgi:hypothetical protein
MEPTGQAFRKSNVPVPSTRAGSRISNYVQSL